MAGGSRSSKNSSQSSATDPADVSLEEESASQLFKDAQESEVPGLGGGSKGAGFQQPASSGFGGGGFGGSDPFANIVSEIKNALENLVKRPANRHELRLFVFNVRRVLSLNVDHATLLKPITRRTSTDVAYVSAKVASLIVARLPLEIALGEQWPTNTYAVLEHISAIAPTPFMPTDGVKASQVNIPHRHKSESMDTYINRVTLWIATYCPDMEGSPQAIRIVAGQMWLSHCALYPTKDLVWFDFDSALKTFGTLKDLFTWFKQKPTLLDAPSAAAASQTPTQRPQRPFGNSGAQGSSHQGYQGKPRQNSGKAPGSSQKPPSESKGGPQPSNGQSSDSSHKSRNNGH